MMDKNKQIEEMAKHCTYYSNGECFDCANHPVDCDLMCEMFGVFANLEMADYRKASEVAEELINTALSKIQIMISAIKAQEESGNVTEFNGGARTALEIVFKDIAELKKKYTEQE